MTNSLNRSNYAKKLRYENDERAGCLVQKVCTPEHFHKTKSKTTVSVFNVGVGQHDKNALNNTLVHQTHDQNQESNNAGQKGSIVYER